MQTSSWEIIPGDCIESMRLYLDDASVNMCVTSPPYFGLRDYGHAGQIGLEPTPDSYVMKMVEVFREVKRVLRDDGTLWLNLGDSYSRSPAKGGSGPNGKNEDRWAYGLAQSAKVGSSDGAVGRADRPGSRTGGLSEKQLLGIPWRVAFALQADGWYLRSDIIWHKPNPMPESVTDRPTKAHEYLFLLSKSARYYYDAAAIAEPSLNISIARAGRQDLRQKDGWAEAYHGTPPKGLRRVVDGDAKHRTAANLHNIGARETRNRRSVWTVTTKPFKGAHFATFPPDLIEPCILAGCPPAGKRCDCDVVIGTPTGEGEIDDPSLITGRAGMNRPRRQNEGRRPITRREQRSDAQQMRESPHRALMRQICGQAFDHYIRTDDSGARPLPPDIRDDFMARGWIADAPPCRHPIEPAGTVLDPFGGAGTTALVASKLNRNSVLCELNSEYVKMAEDRLIKAGYARPD